MSKTDPAQMISWLFDTQALRVCHPDEPFWYTSGTLGPYYINTHFLYGSEKEAVSLLRDIEQAVSAPAEGLPGLAAKISQQLTHNRIFSQLIDKLSVIASETEADFISGGERRDLFFSMPVAIKLGKPHLTLLKNGDGWYQEQITSEAKLIKEDELSGRTALHIADLVTEASSYVRTWLPALRTAGARIQRTIVVVDRGQGGADILQKEGVLLQSMILIDRAFLDSAVRYGQIDERQKAFIEAFMADPHQFMLDFLKSHPGYLTRQIAMGGKNKERALRCMELGFTDEKE